MNKTLIWKQDHFKHASKNELYDMLLSKLALSYRSALLLTSFLENRSTHFS